MIVCRVFIDGVETWSREGYGTADVLRAVVAENPDAKWVAVETTDVNDRRNVAYDGERKLFLL